MDDDAPASRYPRLVDRGPTVTPEEMVADLTPPPQFARASFESYQPDGDYPSQRAVRDDLVAFVANRSAVRTGMFGRKKAARKQPEDNSPGVYLDGGFGVGKTHLLAALWHATPGRKYFGTFIEYTALVGSLGYAAAAELLRGCALICIDEFELDDPGDTMIMTRLLSELVETGTRVAATSNTPPNALGEGRFAAEDFLREIQALSSHFRTLRIDGVDYRHRGAGGYALMREEHDLERLADNERSAGKTVTWDVFSDVLEYLATVHPSRYVKVINGIDTIVWSHVTQITNQSDALRFVAFVDRMYDAQVCVVAQGYPLESVFSEEMLGGGYRKKYLRAVSRLIALTNARAASQS